MTDQQRVLEAVQQWQAEGEITGGFGLCCQLTDYIKGITNLYARVDLDHEFLLKNYPEYSGDDLFPVPSPDPMSYASDLYMDTCNYLEGEYGESRKRLADVLRAAKVVVKMCSIEGQWVISFEGKE